jgi:hypothetical protein
MWDYGIAQEDTESSGSSTIGITSIGHGHTTTTVGMDGELDEVLIMTLSELDSTDINDIMDNGLVQADTATYSGRGIGRGISRGVF